MRLLAQRVVNIGTQTPRATGVNAFCYLHPGRIWLDAPPAALGPGQLVNQIIEVEPNGNRVRSYLEVVAPDDTPNPHIVNAVQSGTAFLAEAGRRAPWQLTHGEIRFEFNAEAVLAAHWQVELRLLLGYIIAVRTTPQSRAGGGMAS